VTAGWPTGARHARRARTTHGVWRVADSTGSVCVGVAHRGNDEAEGPQRMRSTAEAPKRPYAGETRG
jgi:hypothetical protein